MTELVDRERRRFIRNSILGAGAIILAGAGLYPYREDILPSPTRDAADKISVDVDDDPNRHWGFVIDLSKCDGCENLEPPIDDPTGEKPRCSYACRKFHFFLEADPPQHWIRVYKFTENPDIDEYYFPKPCQNCQDAPCRRVCPTGATFQRKDGTILIDHEICIGCRICMAACPYETRFFWYNDPVDGESMEKTESEKYNYNPEYPIPHTRGTVAKCDLCIHKVYQKQSPHCVSACPTGALYYGDFNEDAVSNGREIIPLHKTINNNGGYRYKEDEGTKTSVYYLPVLNPELSKQNITLKVEIESNKIGSNDVVKVVAKDQYGNPAKSTKVVIERETNFGIMVVAEGITDRNGILTHTIFSSNNDNIKARLARSDNNEVLKNE